MSSGTNYKKKPATVQIAMWSAHHRWVVVAVWFGLIAALVVGGLGVLGTKTQAYNSTGLPNTESGKASEVFKDAGATLPDNLILIFNHPNLKVNDPAYRSAVEDAVARLKTTLIRGLF